MLKITKACAGLALFAVLLSVTYVSYMKFLRVDVVFYASLAAVLISLIVFGVFLYLSRFFSGFSPLEKIQLLAICALTGYVFAITIPTVIDRSLSFYILEKLQQRGGGIQLKKFDYIFTNEYMREHRLVEIRITEQLASGTIRIEGDCVRLTPWGERLATFSRYFRRNLLPRKRLLAGEYTSALTDPFQRSDAAPDYLCNPG